jgi:LCP family protein required for cell wall assembly
VSIAKLSSFSEVHVEGRMVKRRARPHAAGREDYSPIRHGRLPRRRPLLTLLKLVAGGVTVVLVSAGAVASFAAYETFASMKPGIHLAHVPRGTAEPAPAIGASDGEVNILLAGTDTRTGQAGMQSKDELAGSSGLGNNDVTMLLHIPADHSNATVVSFPRDLISIPLCGRGTSMAMFNSSLSHGLSCTVMTVEKMTGLTIPYAAVITFDGVIGMSNAIGGVTVCLASAVKERYTIPPLNLAAGTQTLVGGEALSFLRSRHGIGDGSDVGRISNQQLFLSALLRKISSEGVLSNPVTLYKLANAAVSNIQPSDTLRNPSTLVSLALALKGMKLDDIVFVQYPTVPYPANPNRLIPALNSARALASALQSNQPIVLNGTLGEATAPDPSATVLTPTAPVIQAPTMSAPSNASSPAGIVLPSDITGQNASQATCTKGR